MLCHVQFIYRRQEAGIITKLGYSKAFNRHNVFIIKQASAELMGYTRIRGVHGSNLGGNVAYLDRGSWTFFFQALQTNSENSRQLCHDQCLTKPLQLISHKSPSHGQYTISNNQGVVKNQK